jgi:GT2 family glycosyltransferase
MPESELTPSNYATDNARIYWSSPRGWRKGLLRILWLWRDKGTRYALKRVWLRLSRATCSYENWIGANDTLSQEELTQIRARIELLRRQPFISLVLLIEQPSASGLRRAIEAVRAQLYENWELCIAGHGLNSEDVRDLLDGVLGADSRVKVIADGAPNKSSTGNAALVETTGEFVGLIAQNDRLAAHALYMIVEEINACADASLIYTDEDMIDDQGRRYAPHFKTDWNPDLFLSHNYFGRLTIYRRDLIASIGFRAGFEGCEDYDLALRIIERISPAAIRHVPYVLVHRHLPNGEATAGWNDSQNARRALQDHLDRTSCRSVVEVGRSANFLRVRRSLPDPPPRVSIIIPIRDRVDLLRGAVESILKKTDYSNYEIVVVDNQSVEPQTLSYLSSLTKRPNVRIFQYDHPFNYSAINNWAAKQCQSPLLAFLNNDILVISDGWLTEMVSQAMRPEVGAVGAMLYYPDDHIQHAGIIVGFGGVAANCYSGVKRGSTGYFHRAELVQNYSAVTAACLLTRADVFFELDGFNEKDLPVAFNDVDYCLRLRERSYFVTWTPYAELYHLESVSRGDDMSPSKIARFRRDQAYVAGRWADVLSNDPYYSPNLSLDDIPFALAASPRLLRPWKPESPPGD